MSRRNKRTMSYLVLELSRLPMDYIHEPSQIASSYRNNVSRTRKITLTYSVFEVSPLAKIPCSVMLSSCRAYNS